ncbi:hypothetical protein PR002_g18525 [Phytophthora rubi]|uniref:AMP-dependent synthetase/ligase domain-containing protein n=1 Tax=Phytophthora rubi TaxID=129364 RepID=A0A6A3JW99_9STRA|nr:hypothetical protein PR002_g18525 [Phytophthora rubi]
MKIVEIVEDVVARRGMVEIVEEVVVQLQQAGDFGESGGAAAARRGMLKISEEVVVLLQATRSRVRWTPSPPTDVSTLCRTSGTVGDPKGVVQLPRNLTYAARQDSKKLAIYPTDVHIEYLPLGDLRLLVDDIAAL